MNLKRLITLACLAVTLTGCNSTPSTVAYKGEVATDAAVITAMTGWGAYVTAKQPGAATEQKVFAAFEIYKAAQLTLIDATASLAANPTNTVPLQAAENAVAASQLDLINLIASLTNAPSLK